MTWRGGQLVAANLRSLVGKPCRVECQGKTIRVQLEKGETRVLSALVD